ncbi:hypothetical protein ABT340_39735 [Streptosporangium sp. NPDC000239]|uniref:hypothetical protein n=1 Tax=Streptosporangium sp. NPDC000239 TaxID=3154248 RepID=UPI003317699F
MFRRLLTAAAIGSTLIIPTAVAYPAAATTAGSWVRYKAHETITADGVPVTTYFTNPTTPSGGQITGVSLLVQPYPQGPGVVETVDVCYQQPGTTVDYKCKGATTITGSRAIWLHIFDGLDPKGTITVVHTLTGGTYPVASTTSDRATVDYQY